MKVLFVSPEIEQSSRGIGMILKSLMNSAAQDETIEIGLLAGYPKSKAFKESEMIDAKLNHLQLQHYMNEGRESFKYLTRWGFGRKAILQSLLDLSAFRPKTFNLNQKYLDQNKGFLENTDFIVKSPFYYQLMTFAPKQLSNHLLRRIVKKNDIDLVISAAPTNLSNKAIGTKLAHFVHDVMPFELVEAPPDNNTPHRYASEFFSASNNSDLIFTNSEDTKSKVLEANPDANAHVLFGTASARKQDIDTSKSDILAVKSLAKKQFLLFTSSIEKRKNVINLMKAYERVHRTIDMPLVIVGGEGYGIKEIKKFYNSLDQDVRDKIIFCGYVSEVDKYALYENAYAFVFPSLYEGIGLMLIEAMQAELPVITSNRGALAEAGGDAAFYIEDPYNVEEIANAITTVVSDKKLAKDMIKKGLKQQEKFTPEKFAQRFKKALKTIT